MHVRSATPDWLTLSHCSHCTLLCDTCCGLCLMSALKQCQTTPRSHRFTAVKPCSLRLAEALQFDTG